MSAAPGDPMSCDELRDVAAELALGVVSGPARARALSHLGRCAECQRLVRELAGVADTLLLAAPEADPPPGFESRVLAGMEAVSSNRRGRARWPLAAAVAAAVIALVAGAVVVASSDGASDDRLTAEYVDALRVLGGRSLRASRLEDGRGADVGEAFVYEGDRSWVFVAVEDAPRQATFEWEVELAGGELVRGPVDWIEDGAGSWGHTTDVDIGKVRALRVTASNGWRCEAQFQPDNG